MRSARTRKLEAFTYVELVLVLFVLSVVVVIVPILYSQRAISYHIRCTNNLKQIGVAYTFWEYDHRGRFPASASVIDGGWKEFLTNPEQGPLCWTNYAIMAHEFGQSNDYMRADAPKGLVCPSDDREPATSFTNFGNIHLSYFVAVSAIENQPQSMLGGDRNLSRGTEPSRDFGFSPEDGKGNDVPIQTNSKADPVCWSREMHSSNTNGYGNVLRIDGSVEQCSSASFRQKIQPDFYPTTNWPVGHVPSSPSIRVLFP